MTLSQDVFIRGIRYNEYKLDKRLSSVLLNDFYVHSRVVRVRKFRETEENENNTRFRE